MIYIKYPACQYIIHFYDKKDYILLSIFSSDNEKELDLFNKVIKTD